MRSQISRRTLQHEAQIPDGRPSICIHGTSRRDLVAAAIAVVGQRIDLAGAAVGELARLTPRQRVCGAGPEHFGEHLVGGLDVADEGRVVLGEIGAACCA